MNRNYNIGVFDSGLGGVTVLKELRKLLPNENIIYFGDTKNVPYGEKTKEEIQALSHKIVDFLTKNNCKVIIIACNTASIAAYEYLRSVSSVPIIGIINSGLESIKKNTYKEIGIIGTPFTVNSGEYPKRLSLRDKNLKVNSVGCDKLCPMIEKGWQNFEDRGEVLESYLNKLPDTCEALLLACTHYPFIIEDIKKRFKGKILDPSEKCACEVYRSLKEANLLNEQKEIGKTEFYVSSDKDSFKNKAQEFLGASIDSVFEINL